MNFFDRLGRALMRDDSGQDMIEYALLAALVGLAAVISVKGLSTHIASAFTSIGSDVTADI